MSQLKVKELLLRANYLLDKCFPIMPGYAVIKRGKMERILDKLDASVPEDIKEAERILSRKEQLMQDAQNRADRIILDAQSEANRLLSESELLRAVQSEALRVKEQVIAECDEIKQRTYEEVEAIRSESIQEATRIREGAENYAERVLSNLEQDLDQLQTVVRNGQDYLEQMKADYREQMQRSCYSRASVPSNDYRSTNRQIEQEEAPAHDVEFVLD